MSDRACMRFVTLMAALVFSTAAWANGSSHGGGGGSGGDPVGQCLRWAEVDDGGVRDGGAGDGGSDGGSDGGVDAGASHLVCVERANVFGCSASGDGSAATPGVCVLALGLFAFALRRWLAG